jgi:hypothetical protein
MYGKTTMSLTGSIGIVCGISSVLSSKLIRLPPHLAANVLTNLLGNNEKGFKDFD